jgi:hypothetical protein
MGEKATMRKAKSSAAADGFKDGALSVRFPFSGGN